MITTFESDLVKNEIDDLKELLQKSHKYQKAVANIPRG